MIAKYVKTKILMTMTLTNSVIDPVCRDIIRAAKEGDAQLLQSLLLHTLSAKVMINALCYAISHGHLACCRLLLDKGADINGVGLSGSTPLLTAVGTQNIEIADQLLQRGADVNASDEAGRTPLLVAILNLSGLDLIRLLLDAGANTNQIDNRGLAPLWATILENRNPDIMRLLMQYGADTTVSYFGKLLIDVARKNGLNDFEQILTQL